LPRVGQATRLAAVGHAALHKGFLLHVSPTRERGVKAGN